MEVHRLAQLVEKAAHELVGVGPALVDLRSRVAAGESGEGDGGRLTGHRFTSHRDVAVRLQSAGTADQQKPLVLRVQIDHGSRLEGGAVQSGGAQHAHLLIRGENHLQRRMGNVVGI